MKIAYFDCFSGAAGDMIVGACLDAGASADHLREELAKLNLSEVDLRIEKVNKAGFAATSFNPVITHLDHTPHRHLPDILKIIAQAALSNSVQEKASSIFTRLAQAEARVHGCEVEKIHFHEVGAADAIMDIVGAAVALESLGIEKIFCSKLTVGGGTVKCEHGTMPVPAPATAELIKGIEITPTDIQHELLTPTGAAILTELSESFGPIPAMRIESTGFGAGQRDLPTQPNVLRLLIGQSNQPVQSSTLQDEVVVLEANIDDATPELIGHVTDQLTQSGALDVFCTSIAMKKNRPATSISIISRPEDTNKLEGILFTECTTLGIRRHTCQRSLLDRKTETIQTPYGPIRIKTGYYNDNPVTIAPEFEDCQKAARKHNLPLKTIMTEAILAHQNSKPQKKYPTQPD